MKNFEDWSSEDYLNASAAERREFLAGQFEDHAEQLSQAVLLLPEIKNEGFGRSCIQEYIEERRLLIAAVKQEARA